MPERLLPTVQNGRDLIADMERGVRSAVRRLDDEERNHLSVAVNEGRAALVKHAQALETDGRRAEAERELRMARTMIHNLLFDEGRDHPTDFMEGVYEASVDLILSGEIKTIAAQ